MEPLGVESLTPAKSLNGAVGSWILTFTSSGGTQPAGFQRWTKCVFKKTSLNICLQISFSFDSDGPNAEFPEV